MHIRIYNLNMTTKLLLLVVSITAFTICTMLHVTQIPNKIKHVTVFIHGTVLPGLALLNPYKTYNNTLSSGDWYTQGLESVRNNPLLYQDGIILQKGLQYISPTLLQAYKYKQLPSAYSTLGAYQAIGAYNVLASYLNIYNQQEADFYTYGFLGLLSDKHRQDVALMLYKELVTLKNKYAQEGYEASFTLIGYSHGGNVILYLGSAEAQEQKKLILNTIVLLATPLYKHAIKDIDYLHTSHIINCYSDGDAIQQTESISTPDSTSYKSLQAVLSPENNSTHKLLDIRVSADTNTEAFGHCDFWYFNRYDNYYLWQDTKTQAIIDCINPLPLAILVPGFIMLEHSLRSQQAGKYSSNVDIALSFEDNKYILKAFDSTAKTCIAQTPDLSPALCHIQNYALETWQPNAHASKTLKAGLGLWAALKGSLSYLPFNQ